MFLVQDFYSGFLWGRHLTPQEHSCGVGCLTWTEPELRFSVHLRLWGWQRRNSRPEQKNWSSYFKWSTYILETFHNSHEKNQSTDFSGFHWIQCQSSGIASAARMCLTQVYTHAEHFELLHRGDYKLVHFQLESCFFTVTNRIGTGLCTLTKNHWTILSVYNSFVNLRR